MVAETNKSDSQTWIELANITQLPWYDQYIASIYWSMVTMSSVGYGDITPINTRYTINKVGEILDQFDIHQRKVKQYMMEVTRHLNSVNISKPLQLKINKQLEYFIESSQKDKIEGQVILANISFNLQCQYKMDVYGKILKCKEQFKNMFSDEFLYEMCQVVEEKTFIPEEIIYTINDPSDYFYFILAGEVEILPIEPQRKFLVTPHLIKCLKKGDLFGYEDFVCQKSRELIAIAKTMTTTGIIKYSLFYDILKKFPKEFELLCMTRDNANHQKILDPRFKQLCQCCNSFGHQVQFCPLIHLTVNNKSLIDKINYNKDQYRIMYSKRNSKKINCFTQLKSLNNTKIKLQQNTNLLKDAINCINGKSNTKKTQGSEQYINITSQGSDSQSDSSVQQSYQQQQEQLVSNSEIPLPNVASKYDQEHDSSNIHQKSHSYIDVNSQPSRTLNTISVDENRKAKQSILIIPSKSREFFKNSPMNPASIIISQNEEILQDVAELQKKELHQQQQQMFYQQQQQQMFYQQQQQQLPYQQHQQIVYQQQQQQQIEIKIPSDSYLNEKRQLSFDNKHQISSNDEIPNALMIQVDQNHQALDQQQIHSDQNQKKRLSINVPIDQANKQVQFTEESQNSVQFMVKPHTGVRSSVKQIPRKSEHFKGKKFSVYSQSTPYSDSQNSLSLFTQNIQKHEFDQLQDLREKDSMNDSNTMTFRRKIDMNLKQDEKFNKFLIDTNFAFNLEIFDTLKIYKYYFPKNNVPNVLHALNQLKLRKGVQQKKQLLKRALKQKKIM